MLSSLKTARPNAFRRCWQPIVKPQVNARSLCTPATPASTLTYSQVKHALLKGNLTTKLFTIAAIASGVVSIIYYWLDAQNTPESKLSTAIGMIQNDDLDMKHAGFQLLHESTFVTKRTFSGPIGLVANVHGMASANVIGALVQNVGVPPFQTEALAWLIRLTDDHLATASKARHLILRFDPDLSQLIQLLHVTDQPQLKVDVSHLLLRFDKNEVSQANKRALALALHAMLASHDPHLTLTAARLNDAYHCEAHLEPSDAALLHEITNGERAHPDRYAGLAPLSIHPLSPSGPTATPLSIAVFSVFSAAWGKVLWSASARLSPAYRKLVQGQPAEVADALRAKFLRSRRVGFAVFALCVLDYCFAWWLKTRPFVPPAELQEYTSIIGDHVPYSAAMPITHTVVMTSCALWAVKTQKFILVPLFFVALYNHFDLVRGYPLVNDVVSQFDQVAAEALNKKDKLMKGEFDSLIN